MDYEIDDLLADEAGKAAPDPAEEELEDPEAVEEEEGEEEEEQGIDEADLESEALKRAAKEKEKLRRTVYAQVQRNQELQAELQSLKGQADQMYNQSIGATVAKLQGDLQKAKSKIALAVQENNSFDIADANAELAQVTAELNNYSNWRNSQEREQSQPRVQQQQQVQEQQPLISDAQRYAISEWLDVNDDVDPRSSTYNQRLAKIVEDEATNINQQIINAGNAHLIGTPEHLNLMDKVAEHARRSVYKNTAPRMSGNVSSHPVRNSQGTTSKPRNQVKLTAEERSIVEGLDIPLEVFLQQKLKRESR